MIVEFMRKKSFEGGAGTFQGILEDYLKNKSFNITYFGDKIFPDICFVVSGTKHIAHLIYLKYKGVKIVQRLDGFNWRFNKKYDSYPILFKMYLQNFTMNFIRKFLANEVIYQRAFVKKSWNERFGPTKKNSTIILNSAGQTFFQQSNDLKVEKYIITCVEGHIQNDNITKNILSELNESVNRNNKIERIEIYGKIKDARFVEIFKNIEFFGHINRDTVPEIYKKKKRIFFCLEINPPCPNSLIEAIASQIPCLGFDTGSFNEIVSDAGISIPFNGNPWKDENFKYSEIIPSINKIIKSYNKFSSNAFLRRQSFISSKMCDSYLKIINA